MAEVEADRVKRLVEKDIISPIRLEQALAEADVARLRVQQAKSRCFVRKRIIPIRLSRLLSKDM